MKIPKCGIKYLKAKAIADHHQGLEVIGETWKDVFCCFFAKQPVFIYHDVKVETVRHPGRMRNSYICHCDCGFKEIV